MADEHVFTLTFEASGEVTPASRVEEPTEPDVDEPTADDPTESEPEEAEE